MTGKSRWIYGLATLCAAISLHFTNCGEYAPQDAETFASLADLDCDDDCVTPKTEHLTIRANLGGSGTEYQVPANLTEWNIGGDCNEGGYPYNQIRWEIHLNGVKVRDSGMLGMAGSVPVHSRCVNGRYLLYFNMMSIGEDPVNRTGLRTGVSTNRSMYDLYIEIYGMDNASDPYPKRNTLKGRTRISLLPI